MAKCIIEFLEESYQYSLRLLAQSRSERYEDAISHYKDLYISHLKFARRDCGNVKCDKRHICEYLKKNLECIQETRISNFFDTLRDIYLTWIDANVIDALNTFQMLLKEYNLLEFPVDISKETVFFKGRITKDVLTSWDMLHIPFNKRYFISNQRYSLTGQPIIYLGRSILDIYMELGGNTLEDFKVSMVEIPAEMKIYDLRNNMFEKLTTFFYESMVRKSQDNSNDWFFKYILASVCSFPKKLELRGFSFCEEYVLPQMLAQILKNHNYDGIMYYSTKKFDDLVTNTERGNSWKYRENVAIFTNYKQDHVYDRELFDKLTISVPVDITKIEKLTLADVEEVKNDIKTHGSKRQKYLADEIYSAFERVYSKMKVDNKKYLESDLGYLQIYYLYVQMNHILEMEE